MPRYQADPVRRAVLAQILAATARAKEAQRDGEWVTYLIRDPRFPDQRGNPGTPIYVGQTNDFPERVLSRFMKCEKEAGRKGIDCIDQRVSELLHKNIVATYQVLDRQPTRLNSLISETNWVRKCWNAGYDMANRAQLQNAGGPPISREDAPASWLMKFSIPEALADNVKLSIACEACTEMLSIPLARLREFAKSATTLGQLATVWRAEVCTCCGATGKRRIRASVR